MVHSTPESEEKAFFKPLSVVSNVSRVSHVSRELTKLTKPSTDTPLHRRLGSSILMRTLGLLYLGEPLSYKDLGERGQMNPDSIIQAVQRNKEYFEEVDQIGKTKLLGLSPAGILFVKNRIEEVELSQAAAIESIQAGHEKLKNLQDLQNEVRELLSDIVLERIGNSLYIDFETIARFSPAFADKLLEEPDLVLENIKEALTTPEIHVRIRNLPKSELYAIERLRSQHINKLISVEARCVSLSSVRGVVKKLTFECPSCGSVLKVEQFSDQLNEPQRCMCKFRGPFKLLTQQVVDSCNLMLEDLQEKTDNPNTQRIRATIEGQLTDSRNIFIFTPGNELRLVGILRTMPTYVRGKLSTSQGFSFEVLHAELFEPEIDAATLSDDDLDDINKVAVKVDRDGLDELAEAFAPEVHGLMPLKKAILLQLSARKNDVKAGRVRNKPNILLIGDPGVAKSVLGNFAVDITPGSRKAVGGGSSAVGITASVIKEEESLGGYRIEPGALVLSKEILFLDELNNLPEEDKPKLQEGMSEQTVTINKASLHVKLKVTAGIIAAANPKHGNFKETESIVNQFNIPSPILNRFDIIFVVKDKAARENDEKIADKMLSRERMQIHPQYSREFLRKYLLYVRQRDDPEISDNISEKIKKLYAKLRSENIQELIINPRFMESLIRLIKASAKLRLSSKIEDKDIKRAMEILKHSQFQTADYDDVPSETKGLRV